METFSLNDKVYTPFGYGTLASLGEKSRIVFALPDNVSQNKIKISSPKQTKAMNLIKQSSQNDSINEKPINNSQPLANSEQNIDSIKEKNDQKDEIKSQGEESNLKQPENKIQQNNDNEQKKDENYNKSSESNEQKEQLKASEQLEEQKSSENKELQQVQDQKVEQQVQDQKEEQKVIEQNQQVQVQAQNDKEKSKEQKIEQMEEKQISQQKQEEQKVPEQDEEQKNLQEKANSEQQKNNADVKNNDKSGNEEKQKIENEKEEQKAESKELSPKKSPFKTPQKRQYIPIVKDENPNIIQVSLYCGATVYMSDQLLSKKIKIFVKTFFGQRRTYEFFADISTTIQSIKHLIIQKQDSVKSYYNLRLIYPMGTIQELKESNYTLEQYKIPNYAQLILLVQTTFQWDPSCKGSGIKLTNSNLVANKNDDHSDYQTVLGNLQINSGRQYWEIKIDKYVDEEDIYIGIARKNIDLYTQPSVTKMFWGYICLCSRKFGPDLPDECEDYGFSAQAGDIIGVLLEFKQGLGQLTFYRNGKSCGVAFNNLQGSFYPAVSMFYGEVQVSLEPKAQIPLDYNRKF